MFPVKIEIYGLHFYPFSLGDFFLLAIYCTNTLCCFSYFSGIKHMYVPHTATTHTIWKRVCYLKLYSKKSNWEVSVPGSFKLFSFHLHKHLDIINTSSRWQVLLQPIITYIDLFNFQHWICEINGTWPHYTDMEHINWSA